MRSSKNTNLICNSFVAAILALTLSVSTGAMAAGNHSGGHGQDANIGKPGKPSEVGRTITVTMTDNRYSPENIEVKKGETIRFVLKNKGEFVHEFIIGTAKMHKAHQ